MILDGFCGNFPTDPVDQNDTDPDPQHHAQNYKILTLMSLNFAKCCKFRDKKNRVKIFRNSKNLPKFRENIEFEYAEMLKITIFP